MRALYVMNYLGSTGIGAGVLYIGNGQILGTDVGLSRYEGTYVEDGGRIRGTATITATAPRIHPCHRRRPSPGGIASDLR